MKGIKGAVSVVLVLILIATAGIVVVGYKMTDNTTTLDGVVTTSGANNLIISNPAKIEEVKITIPENNHNKRSVLVSDDFTIICDKTVYDFFSHGYIYCNVTNNLDETVQTNISLFFDPDIVDLSHAYIWEEDVEHEVIKDNIEYIPETEWIDSIPENNTAGYWRNWTRTIRTPYLDKEIYDDWEQTNKLDPAAKKIKGLTFGRLETKYLKLKLTVPIGSEGKFDVCANQDCLDPWWSIAYEYRTQILSNYTTTNVLAVNDTYGLQGDIVWALIGNTSYVYARSSGITGITAIATSSNENYWENETDLAGNTPSSIWGADNEGVWHMTNEGVMDSSSNNYDISEEEGTLTAVTGTFGSGLDFDGVGDGANMGFVSNMTQPLSLSAWIYPTNDTAATYRVFHKFATSTGYVHYSISWVGVGGGNGKFSVQVAESDNDLKKAESTNLAINNWYHVVGTFNTSHVAIHVNDVEVSATYDGTQKLDTESMNLTFGYGLSSTASGWFNGTIDEARIYDRELTDAEIRIAYYNGISNTTRLATEEQIRENILEESETSDAIIYETNVTDYEINITSIFSGVDVIHGSLYWNGTNSSFGTVSNSTETSWVFTQNITPNFTITNNTAITSFWNFTIIYANATIVYNETSPDISQNMLWSYYFSTPLTNNTSAISSGDPLRINTSLTQLSYLASFTNRTATFNNTLYTPIITGLLYEVDVLAPMVAITETVYYNFSTNLAYGTNVMSRYSATSEATVEAINITNCSEAGYPMVRFYTWDEEDPAKAINSSMDITMWIWTGDDAVNTSFNFSFAPSHMHEICIYPNTSSVTAFSIQEYWNEQDDDGITYPSRNYYLNGISLSNTTTNINLYLLNSTFASTIGISVQDEYSDPVPYVIIKAQRYYIGENAYRTVAVARTDTEGEAVTRLRLSTGEKDVFYRFILERDFLVVKTVDNTKVIETSLLFTIGLEDLSEYWLYWDSLGVSCSFNNASRLLSCEWSDTSGQFVSANLFVRKTQLIGYTTICNVNSTDTSGLLTCDLSSEDASSVYGWWLEFQFPDTDFIAARGIIENPRAQRYGLNGVFAAMILIMTLAFIGVFSPETSILLSIAGVVVSFALGLMTLSIGAVVGLIIAAAILIYKVGS